jgi:recombination protein RecT
MTNNALTTIDQVKQDLTNMGKEFAVVLPPNIQLDKFISVAVTAVQNNSDILNADRSSLYAACYKAAKDGLLPDNKEAALVIYNTNVAPKGQPQVWKQKVQYMPMVDGIKKKIYSTKLTETIMTAVVYENELKDFSYYVDENGQHLSHRPMVFGNRGNPVGAYAMTTIKETGELCIEFITKEEIDKVRSASKGKDGVTWTTWWAEMAKKSAIRRLAKRLPQTDELRNVIEHDNEMYEPRVVEQVVSQPQVQAQPQPVGLDNLKNKIIEQPKTVEVKATVVVDDIDMLF